VTNQSSEASNYIIEVAFDRQGADVQLATAPATVTSLEPGQMTEVDTSSGEEPSGDFECRVGFVERLSAEN
jgi:hypothetical protein